VQQEGTLIGSGGISASIGRPWEATEVAPFDSNAPCQVMTVRRFLLMD